MTVAGTITLLEDTDRTAFIQRPADRVVTMIRSNGAGRQKPSAEINGLKIRGISSSEMDSKMST
ncbi:hypothetical protein FHS21_004946 [Phyllobacterium trifolii]|uniref:Uncharacterized protein n=1 Tax=Phyllobacterium trifolii TaxID=300193 RepID=A0A839UBY7_9HYPH|nr:hypothetical protein [Phyllobacterium trifolii]